MKLITLYLPEPYLKMLDQLVNERFYPNRAEAIRVAIRDLLNTEVINRKRVD
jgi:Arc/MetJ-type ribon-helix-helix transcriptional regulator